MHAPVHEELNLRAGQRKLAGSSVVTYRSSQLGP